MEWESRLMEEMTRLKMELEQVHIDDRNAALNELKAEQLLESQTLAVKLKQREETFNEEVIFLETRSPLKPLNFSFSQLASLKAQLDAKQAELRGLDAKADIQIMEHRAYIEKQERVHQKELQKLQHEYDTHLRMHSDLIGMPSFFLIKETENNGNVLDDIKEEHKREKEQIKASFYRSLEQIKEEFANEITLTTETLQAKHKKEMGEDIRAAAQNFDYKL